MLQEVIDLKKLYRFYGILFSSYVLLMTLLLLCLSGCGSQKTEAYAPAPEEESAELVRELPDTDWNEFAAQYGEDAAVERLNQVESYAEENDLNQADYRAVMSATAGLDGAGAEAYAKLLGTMYGSAPCRFLRTYQALSADEQGELLPFLVYITGEFDPELSAAWMENELNKMADAWTTAELYVRTLPEGEKVQNFENPEIFTFDPYFAEDYKMLTSEFDIGQPAYAVCYQLDDGSPLQIYVDGNNVVFGIRDE